MPDHKTIYNQEADNYERLVNREDYQGHILEAVRKVIPIEGLDVIEMGAGTGRLTCMLAPFVKSIVAYDSAAAMLEVASQRLIQMGLKNWRTEVADHRSLPAKENVADLAIAGWSICYLVDWNRKDWKQELGKGLLEMERVVRPGGTMIIIETQGTGFETPHPPEHLLEYFPYLESHGFSGTWFRTDYKFADKEEASELTRFFFGEELAKQFSSEFLPECTGLWWKRK